jgi:GAF domain-containing protein
VSEVWDIEREAGAGGVEAPPRPTDEDSERLDGLTSVAGRMLGAPAFVVASGPGQEPFMVSQFGLSLSPAPLRETPVLDFFCSKLAEAVEPLIIEDASRDERLRDSAAVRRLGVRGCIGMPLRGNGSFIGLFCVIADRPRRWSEEEVQLASDLAQEAAGAIGAQSAADVVNPLHLRLRRTVAEALLGEDVGQKVFPRLVEGLCRCLDWDAGGAWMSRSDRNTLRCEGLWFNGSIGLDAFAHLYRDLSQEVDEDMLGQVWARQEPMWVGELSRLRGFPRTVAAEAAGFESGVWLPVVGRGKPLGVIELLGRDPRPDDAEMDLLASFLGRHIADLLSLRASEGAGQRWPRLAERLGEPGPG